MTSGNCLTLRCIFVLAGGIASVPAAARSDDWLVHAGPAVLVLADKADIQLGGAPLPGSGVDTDPQYTAAVEITRFVAPSFAGSITIGIPPVARFNGTGSVAARGRLGSVRYAPAAATVQWHPVRDKPFQPYVGAGGAYMHVIATKDGALTGIKLENDIGPLVQAGAHYFFSPGLGAFIDVKKTWLRPQATASFAGLPVTADLAMDPLVVNAGLALRF